MTPAQAPLFDIGTPDRAKERAGRRELDRYLTPPWVTQALLDAFPEIKGRVLLDPCCGDGRMARALEPRFRKLVLNDIDPTSAVSHHEYDAADAALYQIHPADWIVTNPPFNLCGPIAWQAVQHAQVGVALLLRCTFLEPCEGREAPLLAYVQLLRTKLEALREIALGAQVIAKSSGVGRITRSGRAQIEKALRGKLGTGVSVVVVTPPTHGGETVLDPSGARDKLRSDSGS